MQAAATGSTIPVALDSLQGRFLVLTLQKRPGFEDADVLDAPLPPSGSSTLCIALKHMGVRHVQGQVQGCWGNGGLWMHLHWHVCLPRMVTCQRRLAPLKMAHTDEQSRPSQSSGEAL